MVRKSLSAGALLGLVGALTTGLFAQAPLRGNPTPGTPQPDPPNLADRITVTGCVQRADPTGKESKQTVDATTPSDSRYILTNAKREARVPPGTGTSAAAAGAASQTYRLAAIESVLSPFAGANVEISGAVVPPSSKAEGVNANAPTLQVEFVQKLSPKCL